MVEHIALGVFAGIGIFLCMFVFVIGLIVCIREIID